MSEIQTWDAWHRDHQPFELAWWVEHLDNYRDDVAFEEMWREVKEWIKPQPVVLDIGCGPRPPFAPCIAIEPLAVEYQKITPPEWWMNVEVYSHPAEYLIKAPRIVDTVICWNCIDHTIGWRKILDNMAAYGDHDTRYALATDFWEPFLGHPGFGRDEFMFEIEQRFAIVDYREPFGRQLALLMRKR